MAYESFGTDEYLFEGSLWKTPLDLDALNDQPEPYWVYLFHLTLGHHGIFSLTPIFLFSALGADTGCLEGAAGFLEVCWTGLHVAGRPRAGGLLLLRPDGPGAADGRLYPYLWVFWLIPGLLALLALLSGIILLRGGGSAAVGRCLVDNGVDRRDSGVLHLESEGAELRRHDAGTALGRSG